MQIVPYSPNDQKATAIFIKKIYKEMNWPVSPDDGIDNLIQYFHIPTNGFLLLVKDKDDIIGTGGCVKLNDKMV